MTSDRPPGWYPDPFEAFPTRWWNGTAWAGTPAALSASASTLESDPSHSTHSEAASAAAAKIGFEDSQAAGHLSEALAVLAGASLILATSLSGWTYLSHPTDLQFSEYLPLWLAMFPPFGWAIYLQQRGLLTLEDLSRPVQAFFAALGAAILANAVTWFVMETRAHPQGQPERGPEANQYQVVNHGSVTSVSKATYESLVLNQSRLLLGWPALFVAIALPVIVNEAVRVRHLRATTRAASSPPAKSRRT